MGGASSVLSRRGAAFAAVAVLVVAYYAFVRRLWTMSLWPDIAWLALVEIPAVFLLVYLALPLRRSRGVLALAVVCGALAVAFQAAHAGIPANFAKLAAMSLLAFWFLGLFEALAWVVVVACIVPFVDALSVWKGPTHHIVTKQKHLFSTLSFAFPVPGGRGAANLGLPDLLFFGLFLAAAARFRLRVGWTWVATTASFGATMALAVAFDVGGLPALPLLSVAFLGVNADLILRRLRRT